MILFFDLDGPIIDVSLRYKILHRDLLERMGVTPMAPDFYWQRKCRRYTEAAILQEIGASELEPLYSRLRLELIEEDDYLKHDCLWPWTIPVLTTLATWQPLALVTVRSNRDALERQLTRLDLRRFFRIVLSEPAGDCVDKQKADMIRGYFVQESLPTRGHWIIGDTEADIGAGQLLGFTTVGICCGIRNKEFLSVMNPTHMLCDIRPLPDLVLGKDKV